MPKNPFKKNTDYKLSSITNGSFDPPSPPDPSPLTLADSLPDSDNTNNRTKYFTKERFGFTKRKEVKEDEPFGISRVSFETYRRSFDISASQPERPGANANGVSGTDTRSRIENDERALKSQSNEFQDVQLDKTIGSIDEEFEDVGQEPKRRFWQRKKRGDDNELTTQN